MGKVKFGHGYAWRVKGGGKRENVADLGEALNIKADCGPCGCDDCYGHWTQINAETGDLMAMWIDGPQGGPYVLNIDDYDTAIVTLKALKAAR
jgi:hypothetical protein